VFVTGTFAIQIPPPLPQLLMH